MWCTIQCKLLAGILRLTFMDMDIGEEWNWFVTTVYLFYSKMLRIESTLVLCLVSWGKSTTYAISAKTIYNIDSKASQFIGGP